METEKLFEEQSYQKHQFLVVVHIQATRMENVCPLLSLMGENN